MALVGWIGSGEERAELLTACVPDVADPTWVYLSWFLGMDHCFPRGKHAEAGVLFDEAISIGQATWGADDGDVATRLMNHALL